MKTLEEFRQEGYDYAWKKLYQLANRYCAWHLMGDETEIKPLNAFQRFIISIFRI